MIKEYATVLSQDNLGTDIYSMWIETSMAEKVTPGQFICLYTKNESALLPRPISICEVNNDKTAIRIVYRVAGIGTAEFSWYEENESIAILGQLIVQI